jgi:glyceraldehyde 3-phosphate dehydrogenase
MKTIAGINGFGRFGLHLLKYYLDRYDDSNFQISYINDDFLKIEEAQNIICNDTKVNFIRYKVLIENNIIVIKTPEGLIHNFVYSCKPAIKIPWMTKVHFLLECSGKNTDRNSALKLLNDNLAHVIISATSQDPDATLVYGYNHLDYKKSQKIISYGSCTINGYIPLAKFIDNKYSIIDSDVNVIHNVQTYRLKDNYTLVRKFCTLEKSGPMIMPKLENLLKINYTVIPYDGVSTIDFRFKVSRNIDLSAFINDLKDSLNSGELNGLYSLDKTDLGPEVINCSPFSAVFVEDQIQVVNNNIYIFAYFDNENSVNRYFDLLQFIASKQE